MSINKKFKSMIEENGLNIDSGLFKRIEFVIYCLHKVLGEFETKTANMYFTQYHKKYYATSDSDNQILYMLRKKFHQYYSKKQLEIDLEQYLNIPEKFRLFIKHDDVLILNAKTMIFVDRAIEYDELIDKYLANKPKIPKYIEDDGYYERAIRYGEGYDESYKTKLFEFTLDVSEDEVIKQLPRYREKQELKLSLDFDWESFKHKLGGNWAQRPSIQLDACEDFDNEIEYKGSVHIVGLLGAGKSTFIVQETARLLENNAIKIGIIEPNVAEVIKTYEALKQLGINAVPIIGDSQLKKHRQRYMNSRLTASDSFDAISSENNSVIEYLSGQCLLSHHANDYDILPGKFPCNRLKKEDNKQSYDCPLFTSCGHFKKHLDLVRADVWITTSHSLLASKANPLVDPYRRTYYELFHDHLDIIFVDEADSVQEDFDNRFMANEIFYGNNNSIMRKFQKVEEFLKQEGLGNVESETHRWVINFPHLTQLINRLEYLIANSPGYTKYLIEDTITPRNLFFSIIGQLADPESDESKVFIECLESFLPLSEELKLNEQLMEHQLFRLYDKLSKCPNVGNAGLIIEEMLSDFLNEFDLIFKKLKTVDDVKKLALKKLELFIYIVLIDYYFRIQNNTIDNLASKMPEINSIFSAFKFYNKDFIHLMSESVIGNVFGYKLTLNDDKRLYVHLFNYSGVGRSLIEDWSYIKSELGKKGPAIVLFSGTSYAPASAHFHIAEEPAFLLKSEKEEGDINQSIHIKYDSSDKPIKISGVSDSFMKKEKLKELTKQLMNDIQVELSYWRGEGQNRNVLLIVNSYEQCRVIGDYLKGRNFEYRVLSNKKILSEDEINTSQIEEISSIGSVEVLVAPLSIISRGYNIIDQSCNSYFGSAFFMIRPYISPDDLTYNYRILNSIISPIMADKSRTHTLNVAFSYVRKFAYGMLNQFNEKKFWKHLDSDQRAILSWYTFIPIKQAVGRMQRNGCSCRVFYCDGSFANDMDGKLTNEVSMLKAWESNLIDVNEGTGKMLYGRYLTGLTKAISDFEMINDEEDLF
ncbi:MAG: hypothetical protein KMY55_16835 [Dethiosulfatibacter sp.]|nr:hypothetical protein [Dethiosulfatibacter sp.]